MSDRFGDYLTEKGILQRDDVMKALASFSRPSGGTICLEERYMSQAGDGSLRAGVDTARPLKIRLLPRLFDRSNSATLSRFEPTTTFLAKFLSTSN